MNNRKRGTTRKQSNNVNKYAAKSRSMFPKLKSNESF